MNISARHVRRATAILVLGAALQVGAGFATGLYRCEGQRGSYYATEPCAGAPAAPVPIDRTTPLDSTLPAPHAQPGAAAPAVPGAGEGNQHRLSAAESARMSQLRQARAATEEAAVANEIEIAAIREGADARLTRADRNTLAALRPQLDAADPAVRSEALKAWEALYARYRPHARPHVPPAPEALGGEAGRTPRLPPPPLGAEPPGSRGPLVTVPVSPPSTAVPARPGGPIADPKTGQVLAPAGDRLVDPLTGTIWMRAGPNYVDPTTGRVIPGR